MYRVEKHIGKQKKEKKEGNREWAPNSDALNHLVPSYDLHGSYGGCVLKHLAHRAKIYIRRSLLLLGRPPGFHFFETKLGVPSSIDGDLKSPVPLFTYDTPGFAF